MFRFKWFSSVKFFLKIFIKFWNSSALVWLKRLMHAVKLWRIQLSVRLRLSFVWDRKRPRNEQSKNEDEALTAAATPKRRVIKLTSIKELRAEMCENTHTGYSKKQNSPLLSKEQDSLICEQFLFSCSTSFLQGFRKCCRTTHLWVASTSSGLWSNIALNCTCWTPPTSGQSNKRKTIALLFPLWLFVSIAARSFSIKYWSTTLETLAFWDSL